MSADALDDNFVLDESLVADDASEDEQEVYTNAVRRKFIDDDEEDDLVADSSGASEDEAIAGPSEPSAIARKGPSQSATTEDKKRKRKEKAKEAKRAKLQPMDDLEANVDTSFISLQPPTLQADFMAEMQLQAMPKLSSVELQDLSMPERYYQDTAHIQDRKDLKAFIKTATGLNGKHFQVKDLQPGSPRVLVISGAALRVADVVRDLRGIAEGEVAKLFAKHFKLAEHCAYCQKTKFSIGAGTPDRIQKLIDAEALRLDNLSFLVLDLSKDVKKRNLLDIPESRTALFKLLATSNIHDRLREGKMKLVMY